MKNNKLPIILTILYPIWLLLSFYFIYSFMIDGYSWAFASSTFKKYLLFVFPISIIWAGYIFTNGKIKDIKNKIKEILITSSILLVFAFTIIQWTSVTTLYGQYGASVKHDRGYYFLLPDKVTPFEYETLYREAVKMRYDTTFRKIWTFMAFVFFSTFLLFSVIDNKNRKE